MTVAVRHDRLATACLEPKTHNHSGTFRLLLHSAFKVIACFHGLLPQGYTSFFSHVAVREFWEDAMHSVSHGSVEELRKGLLSYIPKDVATQWLAKLQFEVIAVGEREFA